MPKITCPECGTNYAIYYAVDFRYDPETDRWEEAGPHDDGELDCLECDNRWMPDEAPELTLDA